MEERGVDVVEVGANIGLWFCIQRVTAKLSKGTFHGTLHYATNPYLHGLRVPVD